MDPDTLAVPCGTVASNAMSASAAASSAYGLRRRPRLGQLSCGQVYDCAIQTTADTMTLTPTSKDSSSEWEHPSTSRNVTPGPACPRKESDGDSFTSLQAGTSSGYTSAFYHRGDERTEKTSSKKRHSRRGLGSLPSSGSRSRPSPVQPYHNKFSEEINKDLYNWLNTHLEFPYPTDEQKAELCKRTGLSKLQLRYWFTNVRRRTLPSIIQSRNEERQRKGLNPLKSRSRWESDPRQVVCKDHRQQRHLRLPETAPMYGTPLDGGIGASPPAATPAAAVGEKYSGLWSYAVQTVNVSTPEVNPCERLSHVTSPATPVAYCPLPPSQPVWHAASVAVAHVRNAVYSGMSYDGLAATNGYSSSPAAIPQSPSQAMPASGNASHIAPFVFAPASPHPQLSFQTHASALYSPMEIVPTPQPMGYPAYSCAVTQSTGTYATPAAV